MSSRNPSVIAWGVVNLLFPFLPFVLEGFIRWIINGNLSFSTFSAATLSMCCGLLSILVNQSLRNHDNILNDDVEEDSIEGACFWFLAMAIAFFVLFGLLVTFNSLIIDINISDLIPTYRIFQFIAFVGCGIPIASSISVQMSFKLRTSL